MWTVAIVLADRACNGNEDDGDFYYCFTLVDDEAWAVQLLRAFTSEEDACDYRFSEDLEKVLAEANEGRPPISSVVSEGRYAAYVFDGWPEKHSPIPEP